MQVRRARPREKGEKLAAGNLLETGSRPNKSHVRGHSNSRPSGLKAARARYVPFEQTAQAATC